jgi:hypothetical protein
MKEFMNLGRVTGKHLPKRVAVAIVLWSFWCPTFAQISAPTDTDLRTAYCIRVVTPLVDFLSQQISNQPEGSQVREMLKKDIQAPADALHRMQSYLLPKLATLQPDPVIAAMARADADRKQYTALADSCMEQCRPNEDGGKPTKKWVGCMESCLDSPLQKRTAACRTPGWLPF